jgi:hypothetical protein
MALNDPSSPPAAVSGAGAPSTRKRTGYRPTIFPSLLYLLGMVGIFLGERVLDSGSTQTLCTVVGLLLILGAIAVRGLRLTLLPPGYRFPERALLLLYAVGAVAVGLYFLNSDLLVRLTGRTLEQSMPRLSVALSALWPALWLAASLPVLFVELALFSMARAPVIETLRVRIALLSGLGIALALVFCFAITYVANERDARIDFSYFRTARPGESTKKIVRALDKPVELHLFFPPANEVREEVESYFTELSRESKLLSLKRWDQALNPAKARELTVTANGVVVVVRDTLREQLALPLDLDRARSHLRSLDNDFQKRLLGVTRKQKIAYFTAGHDERSEGVGDTEGEKPGIRSLRGLLVDQGFEVRDLGLAQGLGTEVPADASVVFVLGPTKPFMAEEIASLQRYIDRNGRVLLALDPDGGQTFPQLLANLWLEYTPVNLAHDRFYAAITRQDIDRINIGANTFSSHVSVTTNSRLGGNRGALLLFGSGYLSRKEKSGVGIVNLDITVRSEKETWADKNADFKFTEGSELRAAYDIAAAVTKRNASALQPEDEARVVVLADSDCLTDRALRLNTGNRHFVLDVVRWLGGEERFTGATTSEEDIPVAHTRKEDLLWFYVSIFAVPGFVLGCGFLMTRRKTRRVGVKAPTRAGSGSPPTDKPGTPPAAGPPTSEVSR